MPFRGRDVQPSARESLLLAKEFDNNVDSISGAVSTTTMSNLVDYVCESCRYNPHKATHSGYASFAGEHFRDTTKYLGSLKQSGLKK